MLPGAQNENPGNEGAGRSMARGEDHAPAAYHASSSKIAALAAEKFRHTYANELPSGVNSFEDDGPRASPICACPRRTGGRPARPILLERPFPEERWRSNTILHAFGERAVLKLLYAALQRASCTWQRVVITDFERNQLLTLREELDPEFHDNHRVTQPASRSPISSKRGS